MKYKKIFKKYLDESFRDISTFGSFLFTASVVLILFFLKYYKIALIILMGVIIIEFIGAFIKAVFYKRRPNGQTYSNILEKIDSGSFPSIHSARAFLIGISVYSLFSFVIAGFIFLFVFLIGVSRIYIKKHYVIDVIGGFILGFLVWYLINILIWAN